MRKRRGDIGGPAFPAAITSRLAPGALVGLASAILFGISTPLAKVLLGDVSPWVLAALLYLGSGLGLLTLRIVSSFGRGRSPVEASLSRRDLPWLAGAIMAGGVIAPVLLMGGLSITPASTTSLLLVLEGVFTAVIAKFIFRENYGARTALGMLAIAFGALILAWQGSPTLKSLLGPLMIMAACIGWAIDNNLTRKVSLADPTEIAMLKGLVAGAANLCLALVAGERLPRWPAMEAAAVVGFVGYGLSLVLFVLALRAAGAARASAYFSTAPFLGALVALAFGEPLTSAIAVAGLLMGLGVYLHLTERHEHEHEHEPIEHTHRHRHDLHHQHEHGPSDPPEEPHVHRHIHIRLRHAHGHVPDAHHRHDH